MELKVLVLTVLVAICTPQSGHAFLDVLLKDDMVQLFLGKSDLRLLVISEPVLVLMANIVLACMCIMFATRFVHSTVHLSSRGGLNVCHT